MTTSKLVIKSMHSNNSITPKESKDKRYYAKGSFTLVNQAAFALVSYFCVHLNTHKLFVLPVFIASYCFL